MIVERREKDTLIIFSPEIIYECHIWLYIINLNNHILSTFCNPSFRILFIQQLYYYHHYYYSSYYYHHLNYYYYYYHFYCYYNFYYSYSFCYSSYTYSPFLSLPRPPFTRIHIYNNGLGTSPNRYDHRHLILELVL